MADSYRYGLIGDMSSAALVGIDGSIDWCCFPRFDSPSVFAAILDRETGGYFQIAPSSRGFKARQEYVPDTNVLKTTFNTRTGVVSITDFMPIDLDGSEGTSGKTPPHEIHRVITCLSGMVDLRCDFRPRHDYARAHTTFRPLSSQSSAGAVEARGGRQALALLADIPLSANERGVDQRFTLSKGQSATFVVAYGHTGGVNLWHRNTLEKLEGTRQYWRELVARMSYEGLWREQVVRSFLVLHLMMYKRTEAIIAAPTTSLPETIGGSRNWDYRFAWLRDASFTVDVLYRLGDFYGADRYIRWLLEQCQVQLRKTRIVYGISSNSSLRERILDNLEGYEGSRPVRIGNAASQHLQLDVFGEVIISIHSLLLLRGEVPQDAWKVVHAFAESVMKWWRHKDRGVWEVRGDEQHFVYSKVMCWAALDRAAHIAATRGSRRWSRRWSEAAGHIREEILELGWSSTKQAFRQRYGHDDLDASNLVIPFLGLIKRDDPRVRNNLDAIERELADGPLVWRYSPERTDDGLAGQREGAFTLLSFWLIGNLILTGQTDRGFDYFHETIMRQSNHLGLLAEMFDPLANRSLGNFPQAYSHIGLIHTALNFSRFIADTPIRRRSRKPSMNRQWR